MADKKMNDFSESLFGSYVYGETSNGSQVKIPLSKQYTTNKGDVIECGSYTGLLLVYYATNGHNAIFLVNAFGSSIIDKTADVFSTQDTNNKVCVFRDGTNAPVKIKQNIGDNIVITFRWI